MTAMARVEAQLYEPMERGRVRCNLCAHHCSIPVGGLGACHVRENAGGKLYTLVYGYVISEAVDPVEKKPLFHFYPGSTAYSIATPGCNFRCRWCQNHSISQLPRESGRLAGYAAEPEDIVAGARSRHSRSIAYTYTEPTVFFEYAAAIARLAHAAGIANIFVTNGYMTTDALAALHPYLDAATVDLKAFRETTYHRYVGARLQPVLDAMKEMKRLGVWLEVTTLIIPGLNDDPAELRDAAAFVAHELGPDTPWHLSRFFPMYQMNDYPPTPAATLNRARDIGLAEGLRYVYIGNVADEANTSCPGCGRLLIRRRGYSIAANRVRAGKCPDCGAAIAGVWGDV